MIRRYGKANSFLMDSKKHSLFENDRLVKKQRTMANLYRAQKKRDHCINCGYMIDYYGALDFMKLGIGYTFCVNCGHLNGMQQETDKFHNRMYTAESGKEYAEEYKIEDIEDFNRRVSSIYVPKAKFLRDSLVADGVDPSKLSYLDFGCGSGYFVSAMIEVGLFNIFGMDISKEQIDFGNDMIKGVLLGVYESEDTNNVLRHTMSNVISMVGVLEHLQNPRQALLELKDNTNVKYIFLTLPMFSLSVYLDMLSPDVYHRQLSGGHTHLYTEESIKCFCREFGFNIISEWWFGMDIFDLYRHVSVKMRKGDTTDKVLDIWQQKMEILMDSLQLVVDKNHFCSEVEILIKKNEGD